MGFLNLFSNDQQLSDIDKQIEGVISSVPVRDPEDNSSEDSPSELIHQLLAPEDRFADKKELKKNPLFGYLGDDKKQNGIMTDVGTLLDRLTVQADRASRYKTYEEIYSTVPIIKKMMDVWLSNLMQKNPISGRSLIVKDAEEIDKLSSDDTFENKKEAAGVFVDEVLEYFDFVNKLKYRILPTQTMYGDAFIELVNLKTFSMYDDNGSIDDMFLGESSLTASPKKKLNPAAEDVKLKHILEKVNRQSFSVDSVCEELSDIFVNSSWDSEEFLLGESLAESYTRKDRTILLKEKKESKNLDSVSCFFEYVQNNAGEYKPFLKIKNNQSQLGSDRPRKRGRPKKEQQKKEDSFQDRMLKAGAPTEIDLSNVLMLIHDPKNIVILQTTYGSKLGYVEVADKDKIESTNINQQLNTIIGKLITSSSGNGVNSQEEILAKLVRLIVKKIIEKSSEKTSSDNKPDPEKLLNSLDPTIFNTIKKLIIETDKDDPKRNVFKKLKARFIPITRMFHFTTPANEYYPYGRSFIDPLVLQAKLYILSQLANTIMKLSRAAPIRKWINSNPFKIKIIFFNHIIILCANRPYI